MASYALCLFLFLYALMVLASPLSLTRETARLPHGVLHIPTSGRVSNGHSKRQIDSAPLTKEILPISYWITVEVGTPPQLIQILLDTGSSDTWVQARNSCISNSFSTSTCGNLAFDPSQSSTYHTDPSLPDFEVRYADNSAASGRFFADNLQIGNATVAGMRMGLSNSTYTKGLNGVMGLGPDALESVVQYNQSTAYPSLLDTMVSEGIINTRAYSIYLSDLEANVGSILFGGFDPSRYLEPLITVPMATLPYGESAIAVDLRSISLTASEGSYSFTPASGDLPTTAILDTGSSFSYIPSSVFSELIDYFDLYLDRNSNSFSPFYLVSCNLGEGTINFQFGSDGGPSISVRFVELAIENPETGECAFGLQPNDEFTVLGDTFLRSAYVVFNLDRSEVSMATPNYNSVENPADIVVLQ